MRIALDAMGTDDAPVAEVAGAVEALKDTDGDLEILLVGDQDAVEAELARHPDAPRDRVRVVHAPERVLPDESPAKALRRKPNSSIAIGLGLHRDGQADAFISAGSTGAVMAGSLFILRPLAGVDRPPIGTVIPTARGPLLMLDAGANVDCKPHQLVQFAQLGKVYAQDLMGIPDPRIGLLNIGEEPGKGDERSVETHQLLAAQTDLNFVGNVEGRAIIQGVCDVLVCDGFAGNVLLKFYESVASFIVGLLKPALGDELLHKPDVERIFRLLDYTETGGAPLLGVHGITIICHGGSPPKAIRNAIRVAAQAVRSSLVSHFERELAPQQTPALDDA
ncbi:MAG: phosphate acyltransferase PlsX [Gemmatimonadetes bacterium]|nr:MAG: phosphate acyltransferase PlsX [Gemmatimonadota bacterium]